MSTDTIKTLTIGLISPPARQAHHEGLLDAALRSALAAYSALQPRMMAQTFNGEGLPGVDEQGAYAEYEAPLATGICYATMITVDGEQYRHRLVSSGATSAQVRLYGAPAGIRTVTVWQPAPHELAITTWPLHHEALIALMTASFYLNAVSLRETDTQRAELIQSLAAAYYGRAATTLMQVV